MEERNDLVNLKALQQAVGISPDNLPLRGLYADALLEAGKVSEAIEQFKYLVAITPDNIDYRFRLAGIYLQRSETSKGIVLIEDIVTSGCAADDIISLYIKLLIEEARFPQATEVYQQRQKENPLYYDDSLETVLNQYLTLGGKSVKDNVPDRWLNGAESPLPVEKPRITFENVGGMDGVKEEIAFKIIRPIQHKELFEAYGKKAGGGILLYGPPGCGKTLISRATAGETGFNYMSVGIHEILNIYIGESENNLHSVFDYARRNTPVVIFFDEVDALGASRHDLRESAGRNVINQFLMELDGDRYSNEGILVLAATNAPWHLDSAFLRPGRFDRIIFVPPPDDNARLAIVKLLLHGKPVDNIDYDEIVRKTRNYSGADLVKLVDIGVEDVLKEVLHSGKDIRLLTKYLVKAMKSVKPSTLDWLATAKNYAVYSNEGGLYDEVVKYLKLK